MYLLAEQMPTFLMAVSQLKSFFLFSPPPPAIAAAAADDDDVTNNDADRNSDDLSSLEWSHVGDCSRVRELAPDNEEGRARTCGGTCRRVGSMARVYGIVEGSRRPQS